MSNENLLSRITVDPGICHGKPCVLPERNLPAIEAALESHTLVEVDRLAVTPVA